MITCKHCGEKNPTGAKFCESCGKELKEIISKTKQEKDKKGNLVPCKDCGKLISKNAELCPGCGVRLNKTKADYNITRGITTKRSSGTAAVLGILVGPFGYLYVRRFGLCIAWLIFGIILVAITGGIAAPFLWIGWAVHQYNIAKKINEELGE